MIRITNQQGLALSVPFPAPRGVTPEFFVIPAAKDGKPGVVEIEKLDNHSIERLRWHYERRPIDAKDKGKEDSPHHEIGLLKVEISNEDGTYKSDEKAAKKKAA